MSLPTVNDAPVFDRLAGIETEYIFSCKPRFRKDRSLSNESLFNRTLNRLQTKLIVVPAIHGLNHWFLANGGGLRFEFMPFCSILSKSGFIEGATPECRGPNELLRHQRAQDVLLSQNAASAGSACGDVCLIKSSHDSAGHLFGSHENYEATVAAGIWLFIWRLALLVILPVFFCMQIVADMAAIALLVMMTLPWMLISAALFRNLGKSYTALVTYIFQLTRLPIQLLGTAMIRRLAFRRVQKQIESFLMTRTIISGTGMLCPDGKFVLSPRAIKIHSLCGISSSAWRSVFYFCHFLKAVTFLFLGDSISVKRLFSKRQRLQLSIGDANMAQFAEYLKFGTTLLVLDAIEAGDLSDAPQLQNPLKSLHDISRDPELQATHLLKNGTSTSAIAIQRFYLDACRQFLRRRQSINAEAQHIIRLWEEALDALQFNRESMIGKLDWVTKKHLIETAGADASYLEKQKLALRYHELSREGYFLRLEGAGIAPTIVDPESVLNAMTTPPQNTPATVRSKLIRQFAIAPNSVAASWHSVKVQGCRWGFHEIKTKTRN